MFTIKFYSADGYRQIIEEADSFTILHGGGNAEITLHRKIGDDVRRDIKDEGDGATGYAGPVRFAKAIIENASGKTTQIIALAPVPAGVITGPLSADQPAR